ncbi:MAG TPA: GGDEF domain-containing protein [Patescibacteria group bacterium]|nr:GGDEF domain-containing protein [Patescibacteria group bacterium]
MGKKGDMPGWDENTVQLRRVLRLSGVVFALFAAGCSLLLTDGEVRLGQLVLLGAYSVYNILLRDQELVLPEYSVNLALCAAMTVTGVAYSAILYPLLLLRGVLRVGRQRALRLILLTVPVYLAAVLFYRPQLDLAAVQELSFMVLSLLLIAWMALQLHQIWQNQIGQENRVTELLNMNNHHYRLSLTDELTGLYNYRAYQEMAASITDYTLLLIDIDHFKKINDTYGHLCGDRVLSEMGDLLRLGLREEDLAFRYGGEEFAIVLPDADLELGMKIAERLRKRIASGDFFWDNARISVAVSIGVAVKDETNDSQIAFWQADRALYSAKRQGRNKVQAFGGNREPAEAGIAEEAVLEKKAVGEK